jgi:hypothetical protein
MTPKPEKMYQLNIQCAKWSKKSQMFEKHSMPVKYSKCPENIPNGPKIYHLYNIFQSETVKFFPKLGFLVGKQTIWQPWKEWQQKKLLGILCC